MQSDVVEQPGVTGFSARPRGVSADTAATTSLVSGSVSRTAPPAARTALMSDAVWVRPICSSALTTPADVVGGAASVDGTAPDGSAVVMSRSGTVASMVRVIAPLY